MKQFLLFLTVCLGVTFANAASDVSVTPKVGYNFQTHHTYNQQVDEFNVGLKNHALYGVGLTLNESQKASVEVEYLRTDSNVKQQQAGINLLYGDKVYGIAGGGYYRLDGHESPYIKVGGGVKVPLTNMINLKTEVNALYVTEYQQWTPQALVGFEFKLDQLTKPFS